MSSSDPRFIEFIRQAAAALSLPEPQVTEDRYQFRIGGRWIELKFSASDERVTFASLVYVRLPETKLDAALIGAFNSANLFTGGHSLVAMHGAYVYLCRPDRLAGLSANAMRATLTAFMKRADAAGAMLLRSAASGGPHNRSPALRTEEIRI